MHRSLNKSTPGSNKPTKEKKEHAPVLKLPKAVALYNWPKLPPPVQKYVMEFSDAESLIGLSQLARAYRQSAKEILLKRLFPYDYERIRRHHAAVQSLSVTNLTQKADAGDAKGESAAPGINYAAAFKIAYQRDLENTKENCVSVKNSLRNVRLLTFFKEGRLLEIKKDNPAVSIQELYSINDSQHYSLLHWAAYNKRQEVLNHYSAEVLKLFPEKSGVNHSLGVSFQQYTMLHVAVNFNQEALLLTLLATSGLQLDARGAFSELTALHLAAEVGHAAIAQRLLDKKADVHARGARGGTPLHMAVRRGHLDVVALLIAQKARIDEANDHGERPLNIAACYNRYTIVDLLLRHGADMRKKDRDTTAFDWTIDPEIQRRLLLAEINSAIEIACPATQPIAATARLFTPAAVVPLILLKKAVTEQDVIEVGKLTEDFRGTEALKELYRKAIVYTQTVSSLKSNKKH